MDILLAPHNDDECLFCAYTIMRYKPLVIIVTDGMNMQSKGIDFIMRRQETVDAMKVLGASVVFLGLRDDTFEDIDLEMAIEGLKPDRVFAPAVYNNGHIGHNIVGRVALKLWGDKVIKYATYEYPNLTLQGDITITPSNGEALLKTKALLAYPSQIAVNKVHFDAVAGKPEYYIK